MYINAVPLKSKVLHQLTSAEDLAKKSDYIDRKKGKKKKKRKKKRGPLSCLGITTIPRNSPTAHLNIIDAIYQSVVTISVLSPSFFLTSVI